MKWWIPFKKSILPTVPYLSWGQALSSNAIYPDCRVTSPQNPVSLEFLLLERLMKYREAQGGGGVLRCQVVLHVSGAVGSIHSLHANTQFCLAAFLESNTNTSHENLMCQSLHCPRCGLASMLIVEERVCVSVSLCLCCAGSREGINLAL